MQPFDQLFATFESIARKYPHRSALEVNEQLYSYGDLYQRSVNLAMTIHKNDPNEKLGCLLGLPKPHCLRCCFGNPRLSEGVRPASPRIPHRAHAKNASTFRRRHRGGWNGSSSASAGAFARYPGIRQRDLSGCRRPRPTAKSLFAASIHHTRRLPGRRRRGIFARSDSRFDCVFAFYLRQYGSSERRPGQPEQRNPLFALRQRALRNPPRGSFLANVRHDLRPQRTRYVRVLDEWQLPLFGPSGVPYGALALYPGKTADGLVLGAVRNHVHAKDANVETGFIAHLALEPVLWRATTRTSGRFVAAGCTWLACGKPVRTNRSYYRYLASPLGVRLRRPLY